MATVAILGASGQIGSFAAHAISHDPHVDLLQLVGRPGSEDALDGLARDLADSFAARGTDTRISWTVDIDDMRGADIVVCAAGVARRPGQDRLDLALQNARIVGPAAATIGRIAPEAMILMVTNPVDVMTAVALHCSGLPREHVLGLGTHLDSMRLKSLIADYFRVHVSEVHTRIIGEHGDSMVPLWSATSVGGIMVQHLPSFASLPKEEMLRNVRGSGEEIIRKKGATTYGPGEAIGTLVRTILGDENRILTVTSRTDGEVHGLGGVCIGVPARLNRSGVYPVPILIAEDELRQFRDSVEKIRGITARVLEKLEEEWGTGVRSSG